MTADDEVIQQIQRLEQVTVSDASTTRALRRARQSLLELGLPSSEARLVQPRMRLPSRIAASVVCAIGAVVVLGSLIGMLGDRSVAFADVQERMQQTRSIKLVETTKVAGEPDVSQTSIILANGRSRVDWANGNYTIMDLRQPKIMAVNPHTKQVMILHQRPPYGPVNLYDYIRNMHKETTRRLPDREIEGEKVAGFATTVQFGPLPPTEIKIWVDPKTDLPVRMESSSTDENGREVLTVIHDIQFDTEVDESLFRFEIPEGYTVKEYGLGELPASTAD